MRRFKSPEKLKQWRIEKEARDAATRKAEAVHEQTMMKWAEEHAKTGPCIICPDGKVRTVKTGRFFGRNWMAA